MEAKPTGDETRRPHRQLKWDLLKWDLLWWQFRPLLLISLAGCVLSSSLVVDAGQKT